MATTLSVNPKDNVAGNTEGKTELPTNVSTGSNSNNDVPEGAEVVSEVSVMNCRFAELNKKYDELKSLTRDSKKKGEVAKHSKPQIKLTIGFYGI